MGIRKGEPTLEDAVAIVGQVRKEVAATQHGREATSMVDHVLAALNEGQVGPIEAIERAFMIRDNPEDCW